jgi:hypothetical protein
MHKVQPVKYSDLIQQFGEPGDESLMIKKRFPFSLKLNGNPAEYAKCINFYGNRYIASAVIDAFEEILDIYGLDFIREHQLDWYGGCYENRPSRGSTRHSVHAWGLAVDILPQLGPYKKPSLIPYHYVQAFKNRGFIWGGDWDLWDGMHFSAVVE